MLTAVHVTREKKFEKKEYSKFEIKHCVQALTGIEAAMP
jgi:hypothetical protein